MATDITKVIQDLMQSAEKFVEEQKGAWEHGEWQKYIEDLQKKGMDLSGEMEKRVGLVLEGMKGVYNSATKTEGIEKAVSGISEYIVNFIKANNGNWSELDWNKFLDDLKNKGFSLTGEAQNYIGGILESAKAIIEEQAAGATTASSGSSTSSSQTVKATSKPKSTTTSNSASSTTLS